MVLAGWVPSADSPGPNSVPRGPAQQVWWFHFRAGKTGAGTRSHTHHLPLPDTPTVCTHAHTWTSPKATWPACGRAAGLCPGAPREGLVQRPALGRAGGACACTPSHWKGPSPGVQLRAAVTKGWGARSGLTCPPQSSGSCRALWWPRDRLRCAQGSPTSPERPAPCLQGHKGSIRSDTKMTPPCL